MELEEVRFSESTILQILMLPVIQVSGVRKTYGSTVAVDEVSFEVNDGEIFGLIGPNGAGKTTTMECIEGLRTRDRGTISVLGLDPLPRRLQIAEPASAYSSSRRSCRSGSKCGRR